MRLYHAADALYIGKAQPWTMPLGTALRHALTQEPLLVVQVPVMHVHMLREIYPVSSGQ